MSLQRDIDAYRQGTLSPRDLLRRLRAADSVPIPPVPLSEGQKGLLAQQRFAPHSTVYNVPWCFRVREALDPAAFKSACAALFERHPIFRTRIVDGGAGPVFHVASAPAAPVERRDVAGLDDAAVVRLLAELAAHPFALDREAPLRIHLLSRDADDHLLFFVIHHIVIDGGCAPLLTARFWDAYDRAARGEEPSAADPDMGFRDFAEWQSRWLDGEAARADLAFWRDRLAPPLPRLELAGRRATPGLSRGDGGAHACALPRNIAAAVRELARGQRVSVSAVFLTAYRMLLRANSTANDLVIGTSVMKRPSERFEAAMGFFINMVALRSTVDPDATVAQWLHAEQRGLAEAVDHGGYPLARLVRELKVARDGSGTPFRAAFGFNSAKLMDWTSPAFEALSRHRLEPFTAVLQGSDCELLLVINEGTDGFELTIKYDDARYDRSAIKRLAMAYLAILGAMAAAPAATFAELTSRVRDANPPAAHAHERFESRAAHRPDATALRWHGGEMTYGALDRHADTVARGLRSHGIGAGRLVGLCCPPDAGMIVGLLAILKAGGSVLPLDPHYPDERVRGMINDAAPAVVLASPEAAGRLRRLCPAVAVAEIGAAAPFTAATADGLADSAVAIAPSDLAYAIYTSGSTGEPNGVLVEHRNLSQAIDAVRDAYRLEESDRVLQFVSPIFDVFLLEVFSALTAGASLVLRDESWLESPQRFRQRCDQHGITVLHMPASLWHRLLVDEGAAAPPVLRLVVIGGEPAEPQALQHWFAANPDTPRLLNQYGPTETGIVASMADLRDGDPPGLIGRPVDGARLYLIDEDGQPVADGVAGEVLIGGDGVGRGYLNRPERTAAHFIADRWSPDGGARAYKTGDTARRRPDGQFEFRGRIDRQLKLRGFRIEPEEIEAELARHPDLGEVAVILRSDDPATRRLVAFITSSSPRCPTADELRSFAKARLPDHMVPSSFNRIHVMPLGASGKRDLRALQLMPEVREDDGYLAPRTATEEALVWIFASILKVERIGVRDNFFDLGGDSLSAAQVIAQVRQVLDVEIAVPVLYEAQTVAELAQEIAASGEQVSRLASGGKAQAEAARRLGARVPTPIAR